MLVEGRDRAAASKNPTKSSARAIFDVVTRCSLLPKERRCAGPFYKLQVISSAQARFHVRPARQNSIPILETTQGVRNRLVHADFSCAHAEVEVDRLRALSLGDVQGPNRSNRRRQRLDRDGIGI